MKHELKIWPQYYLPVAEGHKTFEVRVNDRGFQSGDTVVLKEWDPKVEKKNPLTDEITHGDYVGSEPLEFMVGYVLPIDDKRVVFSLLEVSDGNGD